MTKAYDRVKTCYESLKDKIPFEPKVALVLGSGLGDFAQELTIEATIDYVDIDDFPKSTVMGHVGRFVFAKVDGVPTVIMQGRVHYYEGYRMEDVVLPVRLMKEMGAKALFLTNAAGGCNKAFKPADLMVITDHISCFVPSPLIGENEERWGTRFPDMSKVYDREFIGLIEDSAKEIDFKLQKGVYLQTSGPNFETPAEVKMAGILGADAVGMSTTVEAMVAVHMGMKVCGISFISNLASGLSDNPLTHEEVNENAKIVAPKFKELVKVSIGKIGKSI
ncbi:purine-nucleoside phosphorylase [Lagierella sp.]|uniref:purine-nucleoside phosphorylase n=1 Tax=Lagierella sp. TaxID=2849657 RepID=UPI00262D6BAA|nr:purine-nucleoside phosphorylase [Lagierella sp.]